MPATAQQRLCPLVPGTFLLPHQLQNRTKQGNGVLPRLYLWVLEHTVGLPEQQGDRSDKLLSDSNWNRTHRSPLMAQQFVVSEDDAGKIALRGRQNHDHPLIDGLIHGCAHAAEKFSAPLVQGAMGQGNDLGEAILDKAHQHPIAAHPDSHLGGKGGRRTLEPVMGQDDSQQGQHIFCAESSRAGRRDGVQDRAPSEVAWFTIDSARSCILSVATSMEPTLS